MASRDILHKELRAAGLKHDFLTIGNESLITRARNVIAASFLAETNYECLLFIDADTDFTPADVAKLWNLCFEGAAVAAGCYRFKHPDAKLAAWVGGSLRELSEFKEPFAVDYAGTGFLMIRRDTFTKLRDAYPEWEYEEGFPLDEKRKDAMKVWGFFQDPITDTPQGRYHLPEDYFFCTKVREQNMNVIMHPEVVLGHWGYYRY